MKVLYVGFRFPHHSKNGGYDWIAGFPKSDYLNAGKLPFGNRLMIHSGGRFAIILAKFCTILLAYKYNVIHFFYSDNLLINRKFFGKKKHIIATVHLNSADFSESFINKFRDYNAVICLSRAETCILKDKGVNAYYIPHGFNNPTFKNQNLTKYGFDKSKINICFLGHNYRDIDLFEKVVIYSKRENLNIVFHAVGQNSEQKKKFSNYKNVIVYPYISDDEYYSLIEACDYNFLPLTFATANNVLMESQSLGTVSLLPQISGIDDYAESTVNFFYKNEKDCLKIIGSMNKKEKSEDLIKFSKQFCWDEIYKKIDSLYNSL